MKVWLYQERTINAYEAIVNDVQIVFAHQRAALLYLRNRVEKFYNDNFENVVKTFDHYGMTCKIDCVKGIYNDWSVTLMVVKESAAERLEDSMPFSKDRVFDEISRIVDLNGMPFPTDEQLAEISKLALNKYLAEIDNGGLQPEASFVLDKAIWEYLDKHPEMVPEKNKEEEKEGRYVF